MDCKELREALDLYVDGELSPDGMASASAHLDECNPCRRAVDELRRLRRAVKSAVLRHQPPPEFVRRIERRFDPPRLMPAIVTAAVVALLLIMMVGVFAWSPAASGGIAAALDRAAVQLDAPRMVVLEGHLVCRDCVLEALYGAKTMCYLKGHRPALRTADGKIWTLMEGRVPAARIAALVDDAPLDGHRVRVRGRLYRRASCLEVDSFELL